MIRHMAERERRATTHPACEALLDLPELPGMHRVDTPGGPVHVRWESDSEVTVHGLLAYLSSTTKGKTSTILLLRTCILSRRQRCKLKVDSFALNDQRTTLHVGMNRTKILANNSQG